MGTGHRLCGITGDRYCTSGAQVGDSGVRRAAARKGAHPARLAKPGTCWQSTACRKTKKPPNAKRKTSPSRQIPSHPVQQILPAARSGLCPSPLAARAAGPDSPAHRGCCASVAKLWAAGLPQGSYKRRAADGVFFALGECRHSASKAIGGCDGPPPEPSFLTALH